MHAMLLSPAPAPLLLLAVDTCCNTTYTTSYSYRASPKRAKCFTIFQPPKLIVSVTVYPTAS
jgi:hypothetical protein